MHYSDLFKLITEDPASNGKTVDEIVDFFSQSLDEPPKTLEEINQSGWKNIPDWKNINPLDEAERSRRHELRTTVNRTLISMAARHRASDLPGTLLRYPEQLIMRMVAPPDKPQLTEEDKAFNLHVQEVMRNPESHVSENIRLNTEMVRDLERHHIDELLRSDLSDRELVENAEDIIAIKACLTEFDRIGKRLVELNILNKDYMPNTETVVIKKAGEPVAETQLTEADIENLNDFNRLREKYERYTEHFNKLDFQIGMIQNPYYEVFDIHAPGARENFREYTNAMMLFSDPPKEHGYAQGALLDYSQENFNSVFYGTNGEVLQVLDYFGSKGINKDELVVKFSDEDKEYPFAKKDSDIRLFHDGDDGYTLIYPKGKPEHLLMIRADGKDHLSMQLGGAEAIPERSYPGDDRLIAGGPPKQPELPQDPVFTAQEPRKPNWFKRLMNSIFGAFKSDFERYNQSRAAYEAERTSFAQAQEDVNRKRESFQDDLLKYDEQRKEYAAALARKSDRNMADFKRELDKRNADRERGASPDASGRTAEKELVDLPQRIQENIAALARGGMNDLDFRNTVLDLETCTALAGNGVQQVSPRNFDRFKGQLGSQTPPVDPSLKSSVQELAKQSDSFDPILRGTQMIDRIREMHQARGPERQKTAASPVRTREIPVRKPSSPKLA